MHHTLSCKTPHFNHTLMISKQRLDRLAQGESISDWHNVCRFSWLQVIPYRRIIADDQGFTHCHGLQNATHATHVQSL